MNNTDEDECFPWIVKSTPLLKTFIENINYDLLDHLLTVYEKNVSKDYRTCLKKQFKPVTLKNNIKNTLNFFHFYWRNIKERVSDDYPYLNKMTDILKIYLDLEVRIHTNNVDSANILTALSLYLDNSEEHIFKILLKGRYETEELKKIYCPIFAKFLSNHENTKAPIKDFTYTRYLLAFKLWQKCVDNCEEKLKITVMAEEKLGSSMPQIDSELSTIIPKPPNGNKNATCWLMEHGLINLQKICDDFLELEKKIHSFSFNWNIKIPQIDLENDEEKIPRVKKKSETYSAKIKRNQVQLIDLTCGSSDNDKVVQIITKKEKPLKTSLKSKCKKPQPIAKRTKTVEFADAHSTENFDNVEKYCANVNQKCDVTLYNSNETNSDLVNTSTILNNDSYYDKSSDSHHDVVDNSTTCVTTNCDKLISSVLILKPRNAFDNVNEDISSQSDIKLLSSWNNAYEKDDISDVWRSMTFEDYFSESSSAIGIDSYKTLQEFKTSERSLLLRGLLNYSPSDFFYPDGQGIDPNLLRKKPEMMNNDTEFMENKMEIIDDIEESSEEIVNEQNEVSSTSPPIHYVKPRVRRNLKEAKSSISFDLEDLCQPEKLVHGFLPFKKRLLSRRIHDNGLSLFNEADF